MNSNEKLQGLGRLCGKCKLELWLVACEPWDWDAIIKRAMIFADG